jgi:hypothetical protein
LVAFTIFAPIYLSAYAVTEALTARYEYLGHRAMEDGTWQFYCAQFLSYRGVRPFIAVRGCGNTSIEEGGVAMGLVDGNGN